MDYENKTIAVVNETSPKKATFIESTHYSLQYAKDRLTELNDRHEALLSKFGPINGKEEDSNGVTPEIGYINAYGNIIEGLSSGIRKYEELIGYLEEIV